MRLVLLHGWGFDAGIWAALAARLDGLERVVWDRGYFGAPAAVVPDGAFVAIGHSLGAMLLLDAAPGCRGLVAINGFDRFTAGDDGIGVPRRTLDRMLARLDDRPAEVVASFRHRCGAPAIDAVGDSDALRRDLRLLRDGDRRGRTALPILALDGAEDWLLTPAHRGASFAGAGDLERFTHPEGGHDLPWSAPDWCARHIRRFVEARA